MAEKLALKRLAGSDLSFFDHHFRNQTYGGHRQKGINLNTDVFVDQFYPQAHSLLGARWPVLTTLYGPGTAPALVPPGNPQRPITYNNAKNWRLNGGTIPDDPALHDRWRPRAPAPKAGPAGAPAGFPIPYQPDRSVQATPAGGCQGLRARLQHK